VLYHGNRVEVELVSCDPMAPNREVAWRMSNGGKCLGSYCSGLRSFLFFGPGVEQAAQQDELAEVVGVVVKEQDGFGGQ
jgi:hypothetical protein